MCISDAKTFVGKACVVYWLDRAGREVSMETRIHDVTFMPYYGSYLVTDTEDIRLDRVTAVYVAEDEGSRQPAYRADSSAVPVAA